MFEAYAIGITLKLNNLVSPQLILMAKEFEKLDLLVVGLQKSIAKIDLDAKGFRGLATSANATNRAFEKATVSAAAFHSQLSKIQLAGAMPRLPGSVSGPGGGGHGGNIHVGPGGIGLGTMGIAAGAAYWPLAAGGAAIYGGKALYESAKDLNTEQNKLRLFGMTETQNREAFDFVSKMKVYGTTQAENMASFTEAQGVGRESGLQGAEALRFAKIAASALAKLDALGIGLNDESRSALHTSNLGFLRFAEQSGGARDTDTMLRLANVAYKITQSSGGLVNNQALKNMVSQGGFWTQNMTDAGFGHNEPIIGEMGGDKFGTAMATAGKRLTGSIKPTNAMMHEYFRLGIWDAAKVALNSAGGFDHFINGQNPLGEEATSLFKSDFAEFYRSFLKPKYDKFNITGSALGRENYLVLGGTGGKAGNNADKILPIMDNSLIAFNQAMSIDQAGSVLKTSLGGQEAEFTAAWGDFKTRFGEKMLPFFTGILRAGSAILRVLPDATANNPIFNGTKFSLSSGMPAQMGLLGDKLWSVLGSYLNDKGNSPYVSSSVQGKIQFNLNADAKKMGITVAPTVTQQQSVVFKRPQTSASAFDAAMSLASPGA